ncbi:class F sortase [Cryptosporangium phraense]|uniref:class F sortase n=1 Tax=Cryptosporangium phraense TaxID=2593070 RepID=UPI001478B101|nr:class F sortase [Cryptosporangium phraense]
MNELPSRRFVLPERPRFRLPRRFRIPKPDRTSRWPAYLGLGTGVVCLAAAAIYALVPPPAPALPSEVGVVPGQTAEARPAPSPRKASGPAVVVPAAPDVAHPKRLVIPVLGVEASVESEKLDPVGGLTLPDNPKRVGWWSAGAGPGSGFGSVVLAGHVDDRELGPGALYKIGSLSIGDLIWVDSTAGRRAYRVAARRVYKKAQLPGDVFAQSVPERLVLVTCTSPYDRKTQTYEANVVVYASPATL